MDTSRGQLRCGLCNKIFTTHSARERHFRHTVRHGGARQFPCPHCGQLFARKHSVPRHLQTQKCMGVTNSSGVFEQGPEIAGRAADTDFSGLSEQESPIAQHANGKRRPDSLDTLVKFPRKEQRVFPDTPESEADVLSVYGDLQTFIHGLQTLVSFPEAGKDLQTVPSLNHNDAVFTSAACRDTSRPATRALQACAPPTPTATISSLDQNSNYDEPFDTSTSHTSHYEPDTTASIQNLLPPFNFESPQKNRNLKNTIVSAQDSSPSNNENKNNEYVHDVPIGTNITGDLQDPLFLPLSDPFVLGSSIFDHDTPEHFDHQTFPTSRYQDSLTSQFEGEESTSQQHRQSWTRRSISHDSIASGVSALSFGLKAMSIRSFSSLRSTISNRSLGGESVISLGMPAPFLETVDEELRITRGQDNGKAVRFWRNRKLTNFLKVDEKLQDHLSRAASCGNAESIQELLATRKVHPDHPDSDLNTPLLLAIYGGHEDAVRVLLNTDAVDVLFPGPNGLTPFTAAGQYGNVGIIKQLLITGKLDHLADHGQAAAVIAYAQRNRHSEAYDILVRYFHRVESARIMGDPIIFSDLLGSDSGIGIGASESSAY